MESPTKRHRSSGPPKNCTTDGDSSTRSIGTREMRAGIPRSLRRGAGRCGIVFRVRGRWTACSPTTRPSPRTCETRERRCRSTTTKRWTKTMINAEPPEHDRLRGFVDERFQPGTIRELRPRHRSVRRTTFWTRSTDADRIDIVGDFAYPFPVTVIAELLGIPAERRDQFKAWSDALVASPTEETDAAIEENERQRQRARREMGEYFGDLLDERADGDGDDLVTLAATSDDLDREREGRLLHAAPHRGQHHDDEPRHERRLVFRRTRRDRRRSDGRDRPEAGDRRGASVPLAGAGASSCRHRRDVELGGRTDRSRRVGCSRGSGPRTATRTCSTPRRIPSRSAARTDTSRSGRVSTTASAHRSPASKPTSHSTPC